MESVLMSFLCGCAFLGGATMVALLVAFALVLLKRPFDKTTEEYLRQSLVNQEKQSLTHGEIRDNIRALILVFQRKE
jgi:hypothetical protein